MHGLRTLTIAAGYAPSQIPKLSFQESGLQRGTSSGLGVLLRQLLDVIGLSNQSVHASRATFAADQIC
jgi:hypothetical protein